ncbi:MAG TPA: hypothetical protein VFT99_00840 [Roseiflexaceae bacterium]|nr:hypothetical protein [Roseiflexaceae bacterium]
MPNHCENDLYISGPNVDAVLEFIGITRAEPTFDFNTLIPYPERFAQMDDEYRAIPDLVGLYRGTPEYEQRAAARAVAGSAYVAKWGTSQNGYNCGGYEWCHTNWGTKWNAYDVARRDYDGHVVVTFQTAWSPPKPVIVALALRFPDHTFSLEYFERGMGFCGGFTCLSQEDWWDENDEPWKAGRPVAEWEGEYRGMRGG